MMDDREIIEQLQDENIGLRAVVRAACQEVEKLAKETRSAHAAALASVLRLALDATRGEAT